MEIVKLGLAEMQALYEARMKEDFPPSELRPWSSMRTLTEQGSYLCFGFQEGGRILAYAAFARCPGAALLDYYAVDSALRGRGIGQKFLRGLRRFSQELDAPFVLVEVESVESARTQEEAETRRRRIRFYERCGCRPSGVYAYLFGVDYQILYLPFQEGTVTNSQVRRSLEQVYRMTVGLLVGEDRQRFAQVCQVYAGLRA